ncbi:centriolar satellite-associated tubulin polyglutamylase complex regulator 1-like isoform X1 [Rhopilema esculentum]|uniref:centriolar satellite-associated tubulin polyglutamylase complex regulator 1-like isoform X1 n=1 Tax=Rhopilema esculentum TaxID=499914 RepID=UPI0031D47E65
MGSNNNPEFSLTAEEYLEKHHIAVYFEDAITQLLEYSEENIKVNPAKFFHDYFTSVKRGEHTLLRDYSFIISTPHNRSSFIRSFWKCFRPIGNNGGLLNVKEYHSLVCLMCPDFPFDVLQKTARIILMDDAMDCLMSFSDFLYGFQLQFFFETFLDKCSEIYQEVLKDTGRQLSNADGKPANNIDGINSKQYMNRISGTIYRKQLDSIFSCPPEAAIQEMLHSVNRVSFYGFLMALTKNSAVNACIGILPDKNQFMDLIEKDSTSRASPRPLSAKPPRPPSRTKTTK